MTLVLASLLAGVAVAAMFLLALGNIFIPELRRAAKGGDWAGVGSWALGLVAMVCAFAFTMLLFWSEAQ